MIALMSVMNCLIASLKLKPSISSELSVRWQGLPHCVPRRGCLRIHYQSMPASSGEYVDRFVSMDCQESAKEYSRHFIAGMRRKRPVPSGPEEGHLDRSEAPSGIGRTLSRTSCQARLGAFLNKHIVCLVYLIWLIILDHFGLLVSFLLFL